jgi:hypothetical protein
VEHVHANTPLKILIIGAVDIGCANIVLIKQAMSIIKTIEIKLIYAEEINIKRPMTNAL